MDTFPSTDAETGALEVDHRGIIVHADARAHRLLGPGLVGRHVDDLAPTGHARHRADFALRPTARSMLGRVVRAIRTDGRSVQVHVGLLPLSRGRVAVAVRPHEPGVYQDMRANLEALRSELPALRDAGISSEYLDLIQDRIPALLAIGDATGWAWVSARLARCLGWSPEELSRQRYEELIHPEDLKPTAEIAARVIAAGKPGRMENRYRIFGTDRWRLLRWSWDPPGSTGLTLAVAEDLGEAEG